MENLTNIKTESISLSYPYLQVPGPRVPARGRSPESRRGSELPGRERNHWQFIHCVRGDIYDYNYYYNYSYNYSYYILTYIIIGFVDSVGTWTFIA